MKKNYTYIFTLFLATSCSYLTGPEGYFPTTEHDFLEEVVETDMVVPSELSSPSKENHYPVIAIDNELKNQEVPKPKCLWPCSETIGPNSCRPHGYLHDIESGSKTSRNAE